MESGTAFPVNLSCEFFLWGLCSCMEELCLPGKKLLLPEGIALTGGNCACPGNHVPRDSLFLIFVGSVNSLSGHLTPRRFRFFILGGSINSLFGHLTPRCFCFLFLVGSAISLSTNSTPRCFHFSFLVGPIVSLFTNSTPQGFHFLILGGHPPEKESFPFSWGQMLHFHKFPPDKNPRKHHASPEKASAHRSRGSEISL